MSNSIFMITEGGSLLAMDQKPFPEEASFQHLLERYPELLSGELIDPEKPRRWVLIGREPGIPDGAGAMSRWSADHLFIDQDGIPTIVEVKRAENDDVRRKVVAQILEYAANAVAYWPPDLIRTRFEDRARHEGKDPAQELLDRLGIVPDAVDKFWEDVETNLRTKKVRMLIVADHIPRELRQIVEFLNEQMNPSIILGLELRHFVGNDVKTLVPVVFGQTEQAIQEKTTRQRPPTPSIPNLLDGIASAVSDDVGQIVRDIVAWSQANGFKIRTTSKNLYVGVPNKNGELVEPFSFDTDGKIWGQLGQLRAPFQSKESRATVRDKLSAISGVELSKRDQFPTAPLSRLNRDSVSGFEAFLNWMREEVGIQAATDSTTPR
jgi:hypothetical protein